MFQAIRHYVGRALGYESEKTSLRRQLAVANQRLKASYDAARTTTEYQNIWANADRFDADSAHSKDVRHTLISRSRYEVGSNGYSDGIAQTYATDLVGVGPQLRMQTGSEGFNRLVELSWFLWSKAVLFRRRLWCMAHAKHQDGQGLGVFSCRKAAWPGFNPHFRGFGGEELYIHTKYRQAGHKAVCLPWLKWWHRFGRPDGIKYPLDLYSKVRNYVLGHQELGLEVAPIYDHFVSLDTRGQDLRSHLLNEHALGNDHVDGKSEEELVTLHAGLKLKQDEWDFLLADPIGHARAQIVETKEVVLETGRPQPPAEASLDEIFEWCRGVPRDLDRHLPIIRELASKCDHVTEITKRRESTVALLAARPKSVISYQKEADVLFKSLTDAIKRDAKEREGTEQRRVLTHTTHWHVDSAAMNAIEETDLLFLDTVMSGERLKLELDTHAGRVRRFILVRGTGAFGAQAEGSKEPGLFWALAPFLKQHPQWRIIHHAVDEYGITCLSRNPVEGG